MYLEVEAWSKYLFVDNGFKDSVGQMNDQDPGNQSNTTK